jgi:hypothetical protein
VISHAQITTYWMECGCAIQTGQIVTGDREEARRFATNHASQILNDPVVSRIQRKPGSSNVSCVYLVTVRPAHQICDLGRLHPASYVSQGASNA